MVVSDSSADAANNVWYSGSPGLPVSRPASWNAPVRSTSMRLLPPMVTIGKLFVASLPKPVPNPWSVPSSKSYVADCAAAGAARHSAVSAAKPKAIRVEVFKRLEFISKFLHGAWHQKLFICPNSQRSDPPQMWPYLVPWLEL